MFQQFRTNSAALYFCIYCRDIIRKKILENDVKEHIFQTVTSLVTLLKFHCIITISNFLWWRCEIWFCCLPSTITLSTLLSFKAQFLKSMQLKAMHKSNFTTC